MLSEAIPPSPQKLPYVDCLQASAEEIDLSWSWPSPETGVTGVIFEVDDGSGVWRRLDGIMKTMRYQFKGSERLSSKDGDLCLIALQQLTIGYMIFNILTLYMV